MNDLVVISLVDSQSSYPFMLHAWLGRLFVVTYTSLKCTCLVVPFCPGLHYELIVLATEQDVFDYTMSQVPSTSTSSPDFEAIFMDVLKEYKKQTKKDVASYPLAAVPPR